MSVTVRIPTPLRPLTGGAGTVDCAPGTVGAILDELEVKHPGFKERVTKDGALRRFVNVFVAGQDVRFEKGIDTEVADGQEMTILPAVAGG